MADALIYEFFETGVLEIDYDYTDHNSEDDDSLLDADEDVFEVLDEMVDSFKSIDHISQLTR